MEEQVSRLAEKSWDSYTKLKPSKRLLIGIAGIPGSGKTTLASRIVSELNARFTRMSPGVASGQAHPIAVFIPMDGYHLTRAQLSAMPDPHTAHARRGAAFTFDGDAYLQLVRQLAAPLLPESKTLYAPSFDHALKDPVAADIAIPPGAKVCVFEGNYLALDAAPWRDARGLLDQVWFVNVDEATARERLVRRHLAAAIAANAAEANRRVSENDLLNGRDIMQNRLPVDELVHSAYDKSWAGDDDDDDDDDNDSNDTKHDEHNCVTAAAAE